MFLHPLPLMAEKNNDTGMTSAVGQMDIAAYYDNLPLMKLFRWLERNTNNKTLAATALRLQAFPQITITTSTTTTQFKHRTRGGIAGSRSACALGRIPVETSLRDNTINHPYHGLTFDTTRVQQFSWVDNLLAVGAGVVDATQLLTATHQQYSVTQLLLRCCLFVVAPGSLASLRRKRMICLP